MNDQTRNCTTCRFVVANVSRDPQGQVMIGKQSYTCHFAPPHMIPAPGPNGQYSLITMFPAVGPEIGCAQHEFDDELPGDEPLG